MKARNRIVRAFEPQVAPGERRQRDHRHPFGQVLDDEIIKSLVAIGTVTATAQQIGLFASTANNLYDGRYISLEPLKEQDYKHFCSYWGEYNAQVLNQAVKMVYRYIGPNASKVQEDSRKRAQMLINELNILGNPESSILTERRTEKPKERVPVPPRASSERSVPCLRQNARVESDNDRHQDERQKAQAEPCNSPVYPYRRQNAKWETHNDVLHPYERHTAQVESGGVRPYEYDRYIAKLKSRSATDEKDSGKPSQSQPLKQQPTFGVKSDDIASHPKVTSWSWDVSNKPTQHPPPGREVFQARSGNQLAHAQQTPQGQMYQQRPDLPKPRARPQGQLQQDSSHFNKAERLDKSSAGSQSSERIYGEQLKTPSTGLSTFPSLPERAEPGSSRSTGTLPAAPVSGSYSSPSQNSSNPSPAASNATKSYGTARPAPPRPSSETETPTSGPARIYQPTRFFHVNNHGLEPTNAARPSTSDRFPAASGTPAYNRSPQNPTSTLASRPKAKIGQPTPTTASTTRNPVNAIGGATNLHPDMLHNYLGASLDLAQEAGTANIRDERGPVSGSGAADGGGARKTGKERKQVRRFWRKDR